MSISTLIDMVQNNVNIIIILIFAGIPLLIGSAAATKSVSTVSDFFLCNRSLGTAMAFFTIYATWWSSFAFLGSTSSFYFRGPLYWIALGWNVLFGILFMFFGKKLWSQSKDNNFKTPIDFFNDKFHSSALNNFIILLMFFLTTPYISVQFMGGGIIIEMATNGVIPWRISTLLFFTIMIVYLWSGGLRAVAWTDAVYATLIFTGMLLIGIIFIHMTGGIRNTFETLSITNPDILKLPKTINGVSGYGFWFSLLIIMPLGELMMPQIWTRTYAIKERKTFNLIPFLLSIASIAYLGTMLAGHSALILEPNYMGASDYILPTLLIKYLPPLLMSFIVCCAVAACLSTANSQLHSISQILTLDIYKRYFNVNATEKHLVFVAKLVILMVAMLAYLLLLVGNLSTIFDTVLVSFCGIMQLIVPVCAGLFQKNPNAQSALAGLGTGLFITILFFFWHPVVFPISPGILGLAANIAAYLTVNIALRRKNRTVISGGAYEK